MFRSLFSSLLPQSKPARTRKNPKHRPRTLRMENLEGREMFSVTQGATTTGTPASGKPIEGIMWTTQINFRGQANDNKPKLSDFKVEIAWGDGLRETITNVQVNPNDKGVYPKEYIAVGQHRYANDGNVGKFQLIVTNVRENGKPYTPVSYNMVVSNAPLTGKAVTFSANTDRQFANGIVARFTDANPLSSLAEFTTKKGGAKITWQDGSNEVSNGTIVKAGNEYLVLGTHNFKRTGTFPVRINVSDDNGSTTTIYSTAHVVGHFSTKTPTTTTSADGKTRTVSWGGLIVNGSPADVQDFLYMLDGAASRSISLRTLLDRIVANDTRPVVVNADRYPVNIYVDGFLRKIVDIGDLEQFPVTVTGNALDVTQGELIAHFLGERYAAATSLSPNADFETVFHPEGINAQNRFRLDLGQTMAVADSSYVDSRGTDKRYRFKFLNGWVQYVYVNAHGDILMIDRPKSF